MILLKNATLTENIFNQLAPLRTKRVVVSCSGGPDSMVLLDIVRHFYGKHAESMIIVGHIHHGLRETADRDHKIVQKYCKKYGLICESLAVNVREESQKTKTTIEECARNIRKEWLENIREKYNAVYILTAHHADDQAETLLYRITKGTSITGLKGIETQNGVYFRPFLGVRKKEILTYTVTHSLPYGLDETNEDISIPRNMIRHEVLPRLREINPEVEKSLERLSRSAQEIKEGFDIFFRDTLQSQKFSYDWYHTLPRGFQHELLRCLYEYTNGSTHGLSQALISELDKFLSSRSGGKKELGKYWITKKQGSIYIDKYSQ